MEEVTWRQSQILKALEASSQRNSKPIEEIVSIKLRFLKGKQAEEQLYLDGNEYALIDPSIDRDVLRRSTAHQEVKSLEYKHHESGPEIIGTIADLMGIVGGLFAFWSWTRAAISKKQNDDPASNKLDRYSKLSIELRFKNSSGHLTEARITKSGTTEEIDTKAIEKSLKALVSKKKRQ